MRFDFPAHLVHAHKRKGVPIHVFETGECSAPIRGLRRMMKTNPALEPLLINGIDVFGDENNLPRTANKLIFFGVGGRSDERKDRVAVRRRDRYPAATAFKAVISDQTESELVQIESQALILVANENRGEKNAQVGRLAIQAHSCPFPPRR